MKKNLFINKNFVWNGADWKIGSIEFCDSSENNAVLNLCRRIPAESIRTYEQNCKPLLPFMDRLDYDEVSIIELLSPYKTDFSIEVTIGGNNCTGKHCAYLWWNPVHREEEEADSSIQQYMQCFDLNPEDGWMIAQIDLALEDDSDMDLARAKLIITEDKTIYGDKFAASKAGQTFVFINPLTQTPHVLEVKGFKTEQIDEGLFQDDDLRYCAAMEYEITPHLSEEDYKLRDLGPDKPDRCPGLVFYGSLEAMSVRKKYAYPRKEPIDYILWRIEFHKIGAESLAVSLQ